MQASSIYALSLHDALPIFFGTGRSWRDLLVSRSLPFVDTYRTGDGWDALGDPTRRAIVECLAERPRAVGELDRKSTRLNSSHLVISYAVFRLKKKKTERI